MLCRRCIYKKKKKKNCPHSSIILIHQDGFLREFLLNESRYSYLVFRFPEKVWPKLAFPCYDEVKINVDMIGRWKSKYIQSFLVIMGNTLMLQEMLVSGTILWFLYLLVFFVFTCFLAFLRGFWLPIYIAVFFLKLTTPQLLSNPSFFVVYLCLFFVSSSGFMAFFTIVIWCSRAYDG